MATIVYLNDGDTYLGEHDDHPLKYWLSYGREHNQKWLYKGYNYFDSKKRIVVVYTTKRWNAFEIDRRRQNRFLGIKEYQI